MSFPPFQATLFDSQKSSETVVLQRDGLDLTYLPNFVPSAEADDWFENLLSTIPWAQHEVTVYGKQYLTPRLTCWMGDNGLSYRYSNHTMQPQPWAKVPIAIKQRIEAVTSASFNSLLLNYYRNGQDSNGWHSDDEPELGQQPMIASLTLGDSRDFDLRRKNNHNDKHRFKLAHGSLLIMRGKTQQFWQHQIPKRVKAGPRLNLTFRQVFAD